MPDLKINKTDETLPGSFYSGRAKFLDDLEEPFSSSSYSSKSLEDLPDTSSIENSPNVLKRTQDDFDIGRGNVVRRYETLMQKFEALFGRATDAQMDVREELLRRVARAFDGQKDVLGNKVWSSVAFKGLGGVAGIVAGTEALSGGLHSLVDMSSKILPQIGDVITAICDVSNLTHQKEQTLTQAAMTAEDALLQRLTAIESAFRSAMQRLEDHKRAAAGG